MIDYEVDGYEIFHSFVTDDKYAVAYPCGYVSLGRFNTLKEAKNALIVILKNNS